MQAALLTAELARLAGARATRICQGQRQGVSQGLRMKSARQISPLERQALAGGHTPSEPSDSAFKFQMCENTQLKVTFKFTTPVLRVKSLLTINQNGDQEINKASCVAPGAS